MSYKRHIVWFPFLLIGVTVILAITIVLVDRNRDRVLISLEEDGQTTVREVALNGPDVDVYRAELVAVLDPVWSVAQSGSGDAAGIGEAKLRLLEMRVPASERDAHIGALAMLNVLERGLVNQNATDLADAELRAQGLQETFVWINTNNDEAI